MTESQATTESLPEPLLPIVTAALVERGWRYEQLSPESVHARVRHPLGAYDVHVTVYDPLRILCCLCVIPACVPAGRRREVAELLNRINWESMLGCMEMDMSDGEVRYRSSVDVEDGRLSTTMVHQMLSAGHHVLDRHYVAVMRVAFGDVDAEAAMSELGEA